MDPFKLRDKCLGFKFKLVDEFSKIVLSTFGPFHRPSSGVACGVVVIIVGNGHGDTSSNPGRDWLHFT